MFWLLDIIVVGLILIALICGYKRGIVDMLLTTLSVVVLIALCLVGGAGFTALFYKLGVVNNLAYAFVGLVGETNSLFMFMEITSFDVGQILATVVLFLLGMIISIIICVFAGRGLKHLIDKLPDTGVFAIVSGALGAIVYLALMLAIIWALFALIYVMGAKGNLFFARLDDFMNSCVISGWLYNINPFNALFASFM